MQQISLGFDDNLGLPQDFIKTKIITKPYHCLDDLLLDFAKDKLSLAFVPAATLPFIQSDYELIAQAMCTNWAHKITFLHQ